MAERDILDLLVEDHNQVRDLFSSFEADRTAEDRAEVFNRIVAELARHETAEEEIVHPMLRLQVEGGDELAEARIAEQQQAEEQLAELERLDPGGEEFLRKVRQLEDDVIEHARQEELEVFPRLWEALTSDDLQEMRAAFERAKKTAPTHPHPHAPNAPNAPPGNVLLGPVAAVFDRARDAFRNVASR